MKKKKLDQFLPHLFLVGVVAIVAIVALVLHNNGTTGGAATTICQDTEPENDRYIAGTVRVIPAKGNTISHPDKCNGDMVQQWECGSQGSYRQLPDRLCPKKTCESGEVCRQGKLCDKGVCLYKVELPK